MTCLPERPIDDALACKHHWMLGSPVGGVTSGLCRDCGAVKTFTETLQPFALASRLRRK